MSYVYVSNKCKECDATLWSMHAKSIGMCPDCKCVDSDIVQDLEERLEDAIN
jgi:Zn finger protein HypA/HybF involved in hydrogenase expression